MDTRTTNFSCIAIKYQGSQREIGGRQIAYCLRNVTAQYANDICVAHVQCVVGLTGGKERNGFLADGNGPKRRLQQR